VPGHPAARGAEPRVFTARRELGTALLAVPGVGHLAMLRVTAPLATIEVASSVRHSAVLRIALLALFWGSSFLWIKLAVRGLSPAEVTLGRLVLGAGVLFAIVAARRQPVPRSPAIWGQIMIAALFGNAAPYLLFALSEQHVASSTAGMLNATTPLWTVLVALTVRHQRSVSLAQA